MFIETIDLYSTEPPEIQSLGSCVAILFVPREAVHVILLGGKSLHSLLFVYQVSVGTDPLVWALQK